MGLDIVSYKKIFPAVDGYSIKYTAESFPHAVIGLDPEAFYTFVERAHSFRAGSYTSYGQWRSELDNFVNSLRLDPASKMLPFNELIDFSDCEGVIGPATCHKLSQDFIALEDLAMDFAPIYLDYDYWKENYQDFKKAFSEAAGRGVVIFC